MLCAALIAQAAGIVRMRAWAVVLGALTAVGVLSTALLGIAEPTFAAVTSLPGVVLVAAVVAAWSSAERRQHHGR